jgi:hypothetical protein
MNRNKDQDQRNGTFAVMWDCHGLEALARIPDPADTTFALLQSKKAPEMPNIMHWRLRAQANSQRHYEIYTFSATDGIDVDDIREMFSANPQMAADAIRQIGHQIYSDRNKEHKIVIR